MYKLIVGIEHLMTGLQMTPKGLQAVGVANFTFQRESPSVVAVLCAVPFNAYWPVKQAFLEAVEVPDAAPEIYSSGEVEWVAQRVAPKLVELDTKGSVTRLGNTAPPPVVKAMRRKFGNRADYFIRGMDGPYPDGMFSVEYAGMFHGVEPDGYIHT